ncbi:MAG: mechanosensitive ion channel family protein [Schleiferiaceae bacterium]
MRFSKLLIILLVLVSPLGNANAQEASAQDTFFVAPFKDTLYIIDHALGGFSPKERGLIEQERMREVAGEAPFYPDSFFMDHGAVINIQYRNRILSSVSGDDTLGTGLTKRQIAKERYPKIVKAVTKNAKDQSLQTLLINIGSILVAIFVVILLIRLVRWLFKKLILRLYSNRDKYFGEIKFKSLQIITKQKVERSVFASLKILKYLIYVLIVYLALPVLFSVMPWAEDIADKVIEWTLNPIKTVFFGIVDFLPNLFFIAIIVIVSRYLLRFLKFLAEQLENKSLNLPGFFPDWAMPTFKIIKFIVIAFTVVIIFPYLPGSESEVFRGVSVFLGLLFSIGSSSAIGNMVAGLVITYMRPFKRGDRVRIGEVTGDVLEKTLLVTRIRTIKNEEITIPNSAILNGHTINFTTASEQKQGLILHATVTIGYDIPWRQVHELLIRAAEQTIEISEDPKPFVLQTALGDFSVSYQINAYTSKPSKMAAIYSDLYKNIQDEFSRAEIEILSPMYNAVRDGNATTTPPPPKPEPTPAPNPTSNPTSTGIVVEPNPVDTNEENSEEGEQAVLTSQEEMLRKEQEEAEAKLSEESGDGDSKNESAQESNNGKEEED